jgi:hypothetical protein
MSDTDRRRPNEVRGTKLVLTGWAKERQDEVAETLELLLPEPIELTTDLLPLVVLEGTAPDKAERARKALANAGGEVELEDVWVTRAEVPDPRERPTCPNCGSAHTQPFTFAGPAARVNTRCTDCGHRFKHMSSRA